VNLFREYVEIAQTSNDENEILNSRCLRYRYIYIYIYTHERSFKGFVVYKIFSFASCNIFCNFLILVEILLHFGICVYVCLSRAGTTVRKSDGSLIQASLDDGVMVPQAALRSKLSFAQWIPSSSKNPARSAHPTVETTCRTINSQVLIRFSMTTTAASHVSKIRTKKVCHVCRRI